MSLRMKIVVAALSLGLAATAASAAEPLYTVKPKVTSLDAVPVKIMVIGNSYSYYNCGVFDYLWGFAADQKEDLQTAQATIAGADLDWHHVESLINPPGKSWSFIFKKDKQGRLFDAVLLQPNSMSPIDPRMVDNFKEWAGKHIKTIRAAGSEPALVMTWARKGKPEMTKPLADSVISVGNANNAMVIPVGLAFAKALEKDPKVNLIMPDNSHPTAAGSYLESAVIYSALMRHPIEKSNYLGGCEKPLKPELATFLRDIAWQTVRDFYGWK